MSRAARRRQLANLYQAGNEDALLRRRKPIRRSDPTRFRASKGLENVQRDLEQTLCGSVAETFQYGPKRPWHCGYRDHLGLSGSGPLAASSRYGATGTLRILRREASSFSGGSPTPESALLNICRVDEWSPTLRCSTSPSLVNAMTPKTWPQSTTYPHGSMSKRMQPSPWYDAETTANNARACTAGTCMRRVAANHGYTLSILQRNALLENAANSGTSSSILVSPSGSTKRPLTADFDKMKPRVHDVPANKGKRLDQEMDFLGGGMTCITAPKDFFKHGLRAALEARLERQTDQDGLKWNLLKQVIQVIREAQHGTPLQAVKEVANTFREVVGTSKFATKTQFTVNITGKHIGFPESELVTLFAFFQRRGRKPPNVGRTAFTPCCSKRCKRGGRRCITNGMQGSTRQKEASNNGDEAAQRADWTAAVASLRLLARPKESVLSAALGVFEIFAQARGDRIRHQRRLEEQRLEEKRKTAMVTERERWKCRGKREKTGVKSGDSSPPANKYNFDTSVQTRIGDNGRGGDCDRLSLAETLRIFLLVCSNEAEIHAIKTTYRHRFRFELEAIIKERQNQDFNWKMNGVRGRGDGDDGYSISSPSNSITKTSSLSSSRSLRDVPRRRDNAHAQGVCTLFPGRQSAPEWDDFNVLSEAFAVGGEGGAEGGEENGASVEDFSEALVRCPEILEAFGEQLKERLWHRHRPAWMAPILRTGR